ncbi:MAG: FecR domain-containing protein, partial [Acidobacteria bacterium]|nr:FecR domain-containing protein [Acidobacteriota bacterium]
MSNKRATRSYLLLPAIILFAFMSARAQTLVSARILSSSGAVEIQRRTQGQSAFTKVEYRVNDELLAGDMIRTARGGRLVLGLADGSQAIIGEKTTVEILDLSRTPRTIFNVLRGKTRVKIEKVGGRPNPYRVNTPTAVIAVRGTLFDVLVSEKETQVFVHEGQVAVSSLSMPDMPVILDSGQKTRVPLSDSPEAPSRFQWGRNNDDFAPRQPDGPVGQTGGPNGGQHGN